MGDPQRIEVTSCRWVAPIACNRGGEAARGFVLKFSATDDDLLSLRDTDCEQSVPPVFRSRNTMKILLLLALINGGPTSTLFAVWPRQSGTVVWVRQHKRSGCYWPRKFAGVASCGTATHTTRNELYESPARSWFRSFFPGLFGWPRLLAIGAAKPQEVLC
ncbi:MAG: hypothetical protein ACI8P0_002492 [Planctomycetaceae bacterium]